MKNRDFIKYDEPYPTIGELIKDKDYDYVSYRIDYPGCDEEHGTFAGCFAAVDGRIIRWMEIGMILMKKLLNLRNGMTQKRELNTGFW